MATLSAAASTLPAPTIAARLDRLPPSKTLLRLVLLVAAGGFFEFYDLFMTAYIGVGLIQAGIFTATTASFFDVHGLASFVGAGFAGMFIGTLVFSRISDVYGRRTAFILALTWYSIATLVMAFVSSAGAIVFWRFLAGIGVGVQLITVDTYVTEITPKEARGRYIAVSQMVTFCAVPVVAAASLLLIPRSFFGLAGWRYVAIIGGVGGALLAPVLRSKLPESPRWLESQGRAAEAEATVRKLEDGARREAGGAELPPPQTLPDERTSKHGAWREIWSPEYRGRTIMLTAFNLFQTVGFYGFAAWVPTLLLSEGVTVTKLLTYVFIIAILNPLGPLIAIRFADAVQRRWQIVGLALLIAVCGLLWAQQRSAAGIIVLGAIITLANNWFSSEFHAYQAELYPTRIRAEAVGFVYSWSRFSSIFIGFLIAYVLKANGATGVFVVIAIAMAIVAAVIGFAGPNTNKVRLEALAH
ncbi:MAG: MFS transporter [Vulcanimicrobiaceae bacterium]